MIYKRVHILYFAFALICIIIFPANICCSEEPHQKIISFNGHFWFPQTGEVSDTGARAAVWSSLLGWGEGKIDHHIDPTLFYVEYPAIFEWNWTLKGRWQIGLIAEVAFPPFGACLYAKKQILLEGESIPAFSIAVGVGGTSLGLLPSLL